MWSSYAEFRTQLQESWIVLKLHELGSILLRYGKGGNILIKCGRVLKSREQILKNLEESYAYNFVEAWDKLDIWSSPEEGLKHIWNSQGLESLADAGADLHNMERTPFFFTTSDGKRWRKTFLPTKHIWLLKREILRCSFPCCLLRCGLVVWK